MKSDLETASYIYIQLNFRKEKIDKIREKVFKGHKAQNLLDLMKTKF